MNTKHGSIDIDRLMEQIRSDLSQPDPRAAGAATRLSVEQVMARARAELAGREAGTKVGSAGVAADSTPWQPAAARLATKREFTLSELLQFVDADFVEVAFRTVLRRPPSGSEKEQQLAQLRTGTATKVELLGNIRWSPEGMARGVHVDGLLVPYTLHRWRRKRVVGPVLSWVHSFIRLGTLSERQAVLDAAHGYETQEVGRALNRAAESIGQKIGSIEHQLTGCAGSLDHRIGAIEQELAGHNGAMEQKLASIEERLSGYSSTVEYRIGSLQRRLSEYTSVVEHDTLRDEVTLLGAEVSVLSGHIDAIRRRVEATEAFMFEMLSREKSAQDQERSLDPLYAAFEDRFRGGRELVRTRCEPYLSIVQQAGAGTIDAPVLDIGCGRGEWLELLREHSLVARGIDLNKVFIEDCRQRRLDVVEGDAISSLRNLPDASVGAITSMHLVEHLPFEAVVALLDEAFRVLRPGGVILLETPNPENLSVSSHYFYLDPTHRNPLPPEALKWIVSARGYVDARIDRLTLARELNAPALLPSEVPGAESVNVLLASLNAAPDYAIVARRP